MRSRHFRAIIDPPMHMHDPDILAESQVASRENTRAIWRWRRGAPVARLTDELSGEEPLEIALDTARRSSSAIADRVCRLAARDDGYVNGSCLSTVFEGVEGRPAPEAYATTMSRR